MGNSSSQDEEASSMASSEAPRMDSDGAAGGPRAGEPQPEDQMSYWQMAKQGYQELVNAIVRPPRAEYDVQHLGPDQFTLCGKDVMRTDFPLQNARGMTLRCSWWQFRDQGDEPVPCVIYMHGNSSGRPEAIPQLSLALGIGASLLTFDFTGSGWSDGDYVSLGVFERDDLACVVDWLRACGRVSGIALWGRSMGAATALMHGGRDPSIAAIIADSPFTDLQAIADDILAKGREQGMRIPGFVVSIALSMLKNTVRNRAGFSIRECAPINYVRECFIPCLFVAARSDDFITPAHSERLHEVYPGDKNLIIVEGDHNSPRPRFLFDSVAIFLQQTLRLREADALEGYDKYIGMPPWLPPGIDPAMAMMFGDLGIDPQEFNLMFTGGMTAERQRQIEQSLMSMMGHEDGPLPPARRASQANRRQHRVQTTLSELQGLSVRRLRDLMSNLGVSDEGCVEKGDLIDALLGSGRILLLEDPVDAPPAQPPPAPAAQVDAAQAGPPVPEAPAEDDDAASPTVEPARAPSDAVPAPCESVSAPSEAAASAADADGGDIPEPKP